MRVRLLEGVVGKPASLHELARLAQRNIKNVSEDVKYLSQVGLIELKDSANRMSARVNYDKIMLEISVWPVPECPIRHLELEIGGQTARPIHGGQHPVSRSASRNACSRNEFNAYNQPVGPSLSTGSGRVFGVCFGSVLLPSSQ